jgi:hypothetical protein
MAAVRLNVVNIEFCDDMSREFEEVHSRKGGIAIAIVGAQNVRAKRIRRDGNALARMGGENNAWFEIRIWQAAGDASCRKAASRQN